MTPTAISVRLSRTEVDYLCNAGFLGEHQTDVLRQAERSHSAGVTLNLTRSAAEEFRDRFTEHLAKVGFDENYNPTPEGKMLEDFIDRFFR